MLEYIFKAFLLTSLVGTALTLLLTAIKPITRKFLSSKWHYYLWLVVLVAMIVPFRFTEQVSQQPNENISIYSPIQESFHAKQMTRHMICTIRHTAILQPLTI